jgi:hypothetical protein
MRHTLATVVLALSVAAHSASPAVPRSEQQQLKAFLTQLGASDLAFVPTRLPPHFVFESFSVTGAPKGLDVSLTDQRYVGNPAKARIHEISFDTAYLEQQIATCSRKARRTLHVAGRPVYSDGSTVWRCLRAKDGRTVIVSAHGFLPADALAVLVTSARPVSMR